MATTRGAKLPPISQRLRPCTYCGGLEYQVSREVYLGRFRAAVCSTCAHTDWFCTTQAEIADYKRVRVPIARPYR